MMRALESSRTAAAAAAARRVQCKIRGWIHRQAVARLKSLRAAAATVRSATIAADARALLEGIHDSLERPGVCAANRSLMTIVPHVAIAAERQLDALHALVEKQEAEAAARAAEEVKARAAAEAKAAEVAEARARAEAEAAEARRIQEEKEAAEAAAQEVAERAKMEAEAAAAKAAAEQQRAAEARDAASKQQAAAAEARESEACKHYAISMTAATFGDCKCGWPKSAHSVASRRMAVAPTGSPGGSAWGSPGVGKVRGGGGGNRRSIALFMAQGAEGDAPTPSPAKKLGGSASAGARAACGQYRVDMTAARFGDCVCGQPKLDHSMASIQSGAGGALASHDTPVDLRHPGGGRAARRAALQRMVQDKLEDEDACECEAYRVDMTAARFGDCVCGQPKVRHSQAALRGKIRGL